MKRVAVLLAGMFVFIWSINAQDTTKIDVGEAGKVTVVNKGSSTVITIDTDSIEEVIGTVVNEMARSMGIVLDELSKSMTFMANEMEKSMNEQRRIDAKEKKLESQDVDKEELDQIKKSLEQEKLAMKVQQKEMQKQMKEAEMEYRKQLEQLEQYKTLKDVYIDNKEELEKLNGKVTIEIAQPTLRSAAISKKTNADTTDVKFVGKSVIKLIEGDNTSELAVGGYNNIYISDKGGDTVEVRLGNKVMRVTDSGKGSKISLDKLETDDDDNEKPSVKSKKGKFKGHWSTIELGVNTFTTPDYSIYAGSDFSPTNDFMELNYNKSVEFNLNPFHFNMGIINGRTKNSAKLGIVSGLGFNFNNYTFNNNLSVAKVNNRIEPIDLEVSEQLNAKKSKLTAVYMTVPLMMEFTFPGNDAFISAGAIGALMLGSHTKYKTDSNKQKDHGDFYLNPFRYGFTAKIGYKSVCLYGTYYMSDMFQENKGPLTTPFSVGIGLM